MAAVMKKALNSRLEMEWGALRMEVESVVLIVPRLHMRRVLGG